MRQGLNILHILADQLRPDFLGCAGAHFVKTPHIDRLAERGIRFTQCFTNAPVCAPARIGLATGLQPSRIGALDNAAYLSSRVPTFYQRLRDYSYRVGCVGKLDLAKPDPYNGRYGDRPCAYSWGFTHPEECEGKMHAGTSPTPIGPYTHYLQERGLLEKFYQDYSVRSKAQDVAVACADSVLPTDAFEDVYIGRQAAQWVAQIPNDFPWYYFVSFVGPHDPFDPPTEYADRFRSAAMPPALDDTMEGKPSYIRKRCRKMSPEDIAVMRRQYCASIQVVDDGVGTILEALEKRGMSENTIVLFSSDHGEMIGDHGLHTKYVPYEASLGIPLIAAGPGIQAGRVSDALVELIDQNATVCELAGLHPQENIDARSFAPVLWGKQDTHRESIVSADGAMRCIRDHRYKFIANHHDIDELYDLREDPNELRNIATVQVVLAKKMRRQLHERFLEGKCWR